MFGWLLGWGKVRPEMREVALDWEALEPAMTARDEYFVRPDWKAVAAWVTSLPETERFPAWWQLATRWLELIRADLGEAYQLHQGRQLLVLTRLPEKRARALTGFCDDVLTTLKPEFKTPPILGPHAVIVLPRPQRYYEYVSYYHRTGKPRGQSGGTFLSQAGYMHVVLWGDDLGSLEPILAHELTHNCLEHLDLPLWFEEGLTQLMEERFARVGLRLMDWDTAREHRDWWHRHGLSQFWQGKSFYRPDDGKKLSYQLALALVRRLVGDFGGKRFIGFFEAARRHDAGEAAAKNHLGCSLGSLAADFLGPGDWAPGQGQTGEPPCRTDPA